jgi:hypothetical protein
MIVESAARCKAARADTRLGRLLDSTQTSSARACSQRARTLSDQAAHERSHNLPERECVAPRVVTIGSKCGVRVSSVEKS